MRRYTNTEPGRAAGRSSRRPPIVPAKTSRAAARRRVAAPRVALIKAANFVDRRWGWDRVPLPVSIATLIGLRDTLRLENIDDPTGATVPYGPESRAVGALARTTDGTGTDVRRPTMGRAGGVFGRNMAIVGIDDDDVLRPNPRDVSTTLLARRTFIPATSVNLLTAAWVQFEVHDWMSHGPNDPDRTLDVPLEAGNPFGEDALRIRRTRLTPGDRAPIYRNQQTHWWDASQVYGSTSQLARRLRTWRRGHLRLSATNTYPFDPPNDQNLPAELQPLQGSWWVGLAMFHSLFMREHNAICDELALTYPTWSDEQLYQTARLINAALIAKIHTVEWTPAMLANRRSEKALRINWWGLQGEHLHRWLDRLGSGDVLSGIPGSAHDHHGVPYALTEEFLSVYRMHPMIPEEVAIRSSVDANLIERFTFERLAGKMTHGVLADPRVEMPDLFYSFALSHPGQVSLRNYPNHLRTFEHPDGRIDLATIDILRDRERGVPRYNDFRRQLRLPPITRFEGFSDDPQVVKDLRRLYTNPEQVDLMVGLYAEKKPDGFAISDTAFRIFILMASRRLKSDRFFTDDYRPEVYTPEGLRWVEDNTLASVLLRHHPELTEHLRGVDNAFKPWHATATHARQRHWSRRQRVWNEVTASKFALAEPLRVPVPTGVDRVVPVPFTDRFPSIPIEGLVVADRFPSDELDRPVLTEITAEEWLARRVPPAAKGLPSIAADPHAALRAAYPPAYERLYRMPVRPDAYEKGLDLGALAVASPYAYLLQGHGDRRYSWELSALDGFTTHPELHSPAVQVTFSEDDDGRLQATSITSALGTCGRRHRDWAAAQRLAMCAAATHLTLVRHFNWIHLVGGERFALATNRWLPANHSIRRLLQPHVFATHFGNRIVTPLQLAPGGDFERLFSYTHGGLCGLFEATAGDFDLTMMHPDKDATNRKVDGLPAAEPALDNRRALMKVINAHVSEYLGSYFDDDTLANDAAFARWLTEIRQLRGAGELLGEPGPVTVAGAANLLSTLIYMVTVDHEIVDSAVWDYQLWTDVVTPRVYRDGRRLPVDVYQRMVNNNFILNVNRTLLTTDFSYLAVDAKGAEAFRNFRTALFALQHQMDREEPNTWRIEPRHLKANMNY
jgi:hypothetical protein